METGLLVSIATILGIIVSVLTILGIFVKFADKFLYKTACKLVDSIKISDLDPRSEIYQSIERTKKIAEKTESEERQNAEQNKKLDSIEKSLGELTDEMKDLKRDRFKVDLRARLEYVIMKKGNVDKSYWEHVAADYDYYVNTLHMNSYMTSLYDEGKNLFIKANLKK
jgi:hypothetical protein